MTGKASRTAAQLYQYGGVVSVGHFDDDGLSQYEGHRPPQPRHGAKHYVPPVHGCAAQDEQGPARQPGTRAWRGGTDRRRYRTKAGSLKHLSSLTGKACIAQGLGSRDQKPEFDMNLLCQGMTRDFPRLVFRELRVRKASTRMFSRSTSRFGASRQLRDERAASRVASPGHIRERT